MRDASPGVIMLVWDGITAPFLFFWMIGLMVELQRSEALSLNKFLHLPVSLRSAFVINYLSSLVNACIIIFVPAMVGFALGLALSRGPIMLLLFPLLAALLLAVTALTYQFQGWLAALMSNPRRRRTIIVIATATFILLAQLPNLFNMMRSRQPAKPDETVSRLNDQQMELRRQLEAKTLTAAEYERRMKKIKNDFDAETTDRKRREDESMEETAWLINAIVPPGWLGARGDGIGQRECDSGSLGNLGVGAYRRCQLVAGLSDDVANVYGAIDRPEKAGERRCRGKGDSAESGGHAGGTAKGWLARAAFAVHFRASDGNRPGGVPGFGPRAEAKMLLLSPIILLVVFGGMALGRNTVMPDAARPFIASGAIAMVLLGMGQVICNQFGFDRSGFRVYVLSSARRPDILLGKNLAFAPLALGLSAIALIVVQIIYPMRIDHFLAALPQAVSMFLLYCFAANWLSMFAPMAIAAGAMRPVNNKAVPVLLHLLFTPFLPLLFAPTLLPLGLEYLLTWAGWPALPIALLLSLALCAGIIALYRVALVWQGGVLQNREKRILELVTSKVE